MWSFYYGVLENFAVCFAILVCGVLLQFFSLLQKIRVCRMKYSVFHTFECISRIAFSLGDECSEQSLSIKSLENFFFFSLNLISSLWEMKFLCTIACVKGVRSTRHLLVRYTKNALRFGL